MLFSINIFFLRKRHNILILFWKSHIVPITQNMFSHRHFYILTLYYHGNGTIEQQIMGLNIFSHQRQTVKYEKNP